MLARRAERHQSAVRADDLERGCRAAGDELLLESVEIVPQNRSDVRVHHGRHGPLVLAELGGDLRRDRDDNLALGELLEPPLVRRVRVRVQQADRQRLHPGAEQRLDRPASGFLVQLAENFSARSDPLRNLPDVLEVDERLRLQVGEEAEERTRRPRLGEVEEVRPPLGDDQPNPGAVALEHGIRRDRGAVQDRCELASRHSRGVADLADALEDADRLILWRRRRLRHPEATRLGVLEEKIRERAADVDTDAKSHGFRLSARSAGEIPPSSGPSENRSS